MLINMPESVMKIESMPVLTVVAMLKVFVTKDMSIPENTKHMLSTYKILLEMFFPLTSAQNMI